MYTFAMRVLPTIFVCLIMLPLAEAREEKVAALAIRPVPFIQGVRESVHPVGDLAKLRASHDYKNARRYRLDITKPQPDPVVAHAWRNGRLFYLFYKTVERAYGNRPWIVQRIHRVEKNWKADDKEPEVSSKYLVEAFKLRGGAQKRPDRHVGDYGMGSFVRREITKTIEIGFADVPDVAVGDPWPFENTKLFVSLQKYQPERELYDKAAFTRSVSWTLTTTLSKDGRYRITSPELGIEVMAKTNDASITLPRPIEPSKDIVLVRGVGLRGAKFDATWRKAYEPAVGEVVHQAKASGKHGTTNIWFANGLIANMRPDGTLHTLRTEPGFAGKTSKRIRIGSSRADVKEVYSIPRGAPKSATTWNYGDILFNFDDLNRVRRIVIVCGGKAK